MERVEVFKTNVEDNSAARALVKKLKQLFPKSRINFDLEDCDKILRIQSQHPINVKRLTYWLEREGYIASILN